MRAGRWWSGMPHQGGGLAEGEALAATATGAVQGGLDLMGEVLDGEWHVVLFQKFLLAVAADLELAISRKEKRGQKIERND